MRGRPNSSTDRVFRFGRKDVGSIPAWGTREPERSSVRGSPELIYNLVLGTLNVLRLSTKK